MVDNKVKKTHQKNPAQIFSFFLFIKIFDLRKLYARTKLFEEGGILKKKSLSAVV